jgi:hypothetical protein
VSHVGFGSNLDPGAIQRGEERFGVRGSDKWRLRRQLGRIIVGKGLSNGWIVLDLSGEIGERLYVDVIAAGQHSHREREHRLHWPDIPLEEPTPLGERPVNTLIDAAF